jgi:cytochrome c oxidase subunit 2
MIILAELALFPQQASTTAQAIDLLFFFLMIVCGSVGLLVAGLLICFSVKYRRRPGQVASPPAAHQSHALEWFWTLTPLAVFFLMFIWGAIVYVGAYRAPEDATTIYGIGKQWMWKFQHPEGQREINTLHVPVGQAIRMLLTSEDVIHSFFVPAFRIHMDVLPERFTSVWFQATQEGKFHLFCSQYCGTGHANMIGTVIAMSAADYQYWLQSTAEGSLALQGRKVFLKYRCVSCHSADENARAPVLEQLYGKPVALRDGRTVIADDEYLRESILHPAAKVVAGYDVIMPTFEGLVSEEELIELIGFIKALGPGETPRRVEDYPPPVRIENPAATKNIPSGAEPSAVEGSQR